MKCCVQTAFQSLAWEIVVLVEVQKMAVMHQKLCVVTAQRVKEAKGAVKKACRKFVGDTAKRFCVTRA